MKSSCTEPAEERSWTRRTENTVTVSPALSKKIRVVHCCGWVKNVWTEASLWCMQRRIAENWDGTETLWYHKSHYKAKGIAILHCEEHKVMIGLTRPQPTSTPHYIDSTHSPRKTYWWSISRCKLSLPQTPKFLHTQCETLNKNLWNIPKSKKKIKYIVKR